MLAQSAHHQQPDLRYAKLSQIGCQPLRNTPVMKHGPCQEPHHPMTTAPHSGPTLLRPDDAVITTINCKMTTAALTTLLWHGGTGDLCPVRLLELANFFCV